MKIFLTLSLLCIISMQRAVWSPQQANQWWQLNGGWFAGCNFIPSTAVNTLEMWQDQTYDAYTIKKELALAQGLGFTVVRVFIHPLLWQQDPKAFKSRIDNFLSIASASNIRTMLVLFDDCWNPEGKLGPQPEPRKGVHNSQWVQSPGDKQYQDQSLFKLYHSYVVDIISSFKDDKRVFLWDIYNEPGNSGHEGRTLPLLKKVFEWAWEAGPSQPISSGPWNWDSAFNELNTFQLENSDIITFHHYNSVESTHYQLSQYQEYGRPVICTEYMARPIGSKFQTHIPMFREANVGAINWGLVAGRTNTIYPWGSPEGADEPKVWFHDIFRKDGTPFDQEEVDTIIRNTFNN